MKKVVITGVSSGIGKAAAQALLRRGYEVWGSVRKLEDAQDLEESGEGRFHTLILDVRESDQIQAAADQVAEKLQGQTLHALINNSGLAIGGPILHQPMEEIRLHFDVNVLGLIETTKAFLPHLGASKNFQGSPGRIINISSVGGKVAAPFVAAYSATKHAVEGFSHSLRRELLLYGIQVVIVGPGAVKTPIWDKGVDLSPYKDSDYSEVIEKFADLFVGKAQKKALSPDFLGNKLADICDAKKPRIRYAYVPEAFQNWYLPRILPERMVDQAIGKQTGLIKK